MVAVLQGLFPVEVDDDPLLPRREPEISGNPAVVFIDAPVTLSPVLKSSSQAGHSKTQGSVRRST
jgi:hypothetical protein